MTNPDDVLEELNRHVRETGEPIATARDLAEGLPVTRRTVLQRLDVLEARGDVGSRDVGRGRAFWPSWAEPSEVPPAEPQEEPQSMNRHTEAMDRHTPTVPPAEASEEPREEPAPEAPADPPSESDGDVLEAIVDDVARDWTGETKQQRREAALAALQWLRDDGGPASASDVREALLPAYDVDGQSKQTWWRTSARPALSEATERGLATYEHGKHVYTWSE